MSIPWDYMKAFLEPLDNIDEKNFYTLKRAKIIVLWSVCFESALHSINTSTGVVKNFEVHQSSAMYGNGQGDVFK